MLDDLDRVPWAELEHAYGDGAEVPGHLRAVASAKRPAAGRALSRLEQILEHQGTVYPATAAAVPFVRELLAAAEPRTRIRLLGLMRRIADGGGYRQQHAGLSFLPAASAADLEAERAYVAAAREQVLAGVPAYLSALGDPDPAVRANAAHLLAALPDRADQIVPGLAGRLDVEDDPLVRVCLVLAVGELTRRASTDPGQVLNVLAPLLDAENADLRAAAAVALRWQGDRIQQPATVLPVLARSLGRKLPVLAKALWVEDDPYDLLAEAMGTDLGENVPFLREALTSRSSSVRDAGVSRASTLMFQWRHTPPLLVPELVPSLADGTPAVRAHAVSVVVDNGWPALDAAVDALAQALADAGTRVDLDRVQQRPQLSVRDPDERIVVVALTALAERGDVRALDGVRRLLRSNALALSWDPVLAGLAAHAGELMPDARYALETADPDAPPVLSRVTRLASGLASWGHRAAPAIAVLLGMLGSGDRNHTDSIRHTLVRITPPDHPLHTEVVARIAGLLDDEETRPWAIVDYWRLTGDHARAVEVLLDVPDRYSTYVLNELAELGPAATAAMPRVRAALASGRDEDPHAFAAARAWWRITGDPQYLVPHLMATLHPRRITPAHARMLGEIGRPAEAAVPFLSEVRDRLRRYSIRGFNTTVRQDEELRGAAADAVARITGELSPPGAR